MPKTRPKKQSETSSVSRYNSSPPALPCAILCFENEPQYLSLGCIFSIHPTPPRSPELDPRKTLIGSTYTQPTRRVCLCINNQGIINKSPQPDTHVWILLDTLPTLFLSILIQYKSKMNYSYSPGSSASSSPISIGWPSPSGSESSSPRSIPATSKSNMACAFPSWPTGPALSQYTTGAPSAFISDVDLFLDDLLDGEAPFLHEAPAPPRDIPLPAVAMPLQPLFAQPKPKKESRRRSSGKKIRRTSKPMSPIAESPEMRE